MPETSRSKAAVCQWLSEADAFKAFGTHAGRTESAGHIKPLHWYVASRLVVEGGFNPDWITPRPPFQIVRKGRKKDRRFSLRFDPAYGKGGEMTILGGLKTKNVDVVVSIPGVGPVLAVSCKGVTKAFRNLTNRMEETIGECTNLHITYPAMVIGYFAVLRANRTVDDAAEAPELEEADDAAAETPESVDEVGAEDQNEDGDVSPEVGREATASARNDLAFDADGEVVDGIVRFHNALAEMTGRRGIRDEVSRYEAMTTVMIEPRGDNAGSAYVGFPMPDSKLHLSSFFKTLYQRYEERFVIGAPLLSGDTARYFWDELSPALDESSPPAGAPRLDYEARLAR